MIGKKIESAINDQINAEFYSSYLYLSMSADLEGNGLKGFAAWMKAQAQEELFHAMKLYEFIVERGGHVELTAINEPPGKWKSPLNIFQEAYKHEVKVTGLINDLVNLSIKEKDHATNNFLQWYVKEQVEEEASTDEIVQKLNLVGNDKNGLFMLDKDLAARPLAFTIPIAAAGA
jgi:ferritin